MRSPSNSAVNSHTHITRSERIERLPFGRQHARLLGASGIGWALDAMDIGLISFVMVALIKEWNLSPWEQSALVSTGFIGMAVGAAVAGFLADRIGRRQVFALTLMLYGLATGASALVGSLGVLLILRFIVGLGLGGELPVASTLVSEFSPQNMRGRIVIALESFWTVGWLAAAVIGYYVVPLENGWRWALALGMIPAVWSLVVRFSLPESVRYLESTGKNAEAERTVCAWEANASAGATLTSAHRGVQRESHDPEEGHAHTAGVISLPSTGTQVALFTPKYRRRTSGLWMVWFGLNFAYYGAFMWLPTLLVAHGLTMVKSFEYTLFITLAQLPGYLVAAIFIEKWGRKPTLIVFLAGSMASAVFFGFAPVLGQAMGLHEQGSVGTLVLIAGFLLSFFNLGAWGAVYAITPEVYPTYFRATGAGAATAFGRVAAILAPLTIPLLQGYGLTPLFLLFAAMFALAVAGALLLPEAKGKSLDYV